MGKVADKDGSTVPEASKMSDARQREQSPGTARAGVARQPGQENET